MEKPADKFSVAVLALCGVALLFYVLNEKGILSEVTAAYVQAIFSVGAISAAVWIDQGGKRRKEREEAFQNTQRLRLAVGLAAHAVETLGELTAPARGGDLNVISPTRSEIALTVLDRVCIGALADPQTVVAISTIVGAGQHMKQQFDHWRKDIDIENGVYDKDGVDGTSEAIAGHIKADLGYTVDALRELVSAWFSAVNNRGATEREINLEMGQLIGRISSEVTISKMTGSA